MNIYLHAFDNALDHYNTLTPIGRCGVIYMKYVYFPRYVGEAPIDFQRFG